MFTSENFLNTLLRPIPEDIREIARKFIDKTDQFPTYAMGRNEHALALHKAIGLAGIVDDFFAGEQWQGCPIIRCNALPNNAQVVNCVFSSHSITAQNKLLKCVPQANITYFDLKTCYPDHIPSLEFSKEMQFELKHNAKHWNHIYKLLQDEKSAQVLHDIVLFRLTGDPAYMKKYKFSPQNQYFDDIAPIPPKAVIVDAGGYDGDTTELFCKHAKDYSDIFLFEPSQANIAKARTRLTHKRNIHFISKGLYDIQGKAYFNDGQGTASSISTEGTTQIELTTIDHALEGHSATFIKMDIEGFELAALRGARQQIINNHPTLAISVYHNTNDFWRIPEFIFSLRSDYKIALRHYTQGWSETVMYFIPA